VAVLCDASERRLAEIGQNYPNALLTKQASEVLESSDIGVVSIASYDQDHAEQTLAALTAGKHVFVEKPLCRSMEELLQIKQAWAEHRNLKLLSNLVLRAAPLYRWLKDSIEQGVLGDIYAFDGDYLYGRLEKIVAGWRRDVDHYSVMQGGGVHLVDLMLWLTGQQPFGVTAFGNQISTAGTEFRYNDFLSATFQFTSGLIGRITANFGCVHRHQHVVRIFGTRGTFIYDDQGPRLYTSRDPEVLATPLDLSPLPASKGDLIPGFIEAILSGKDTQADTQHEFDVISACVAADRAASRTQCMEIEYV
jgi:predicted dehydrogenase